MACAQTGSGKTVSFSFFSSNKYSLFNQWLFRLLFFYQSYQIYLNIMRMNYLKNIIHHHLFVLLFHRHVNLLYKQKVKQENLPIKLLLYLVCYLEQKKFFSRLIISWIGSAVGGHDMFTVSDRLREGCHILSATTGRLKDMVEKGRVSWIKIFNIKILNFYERFH